ncbi:hypothetical protein lerEdw1_009998, partial [Lerista edwardsae]
KVLLSLTVLCLTLALVHGSCLYSRHVGELTEDGKLVMPAGCIDPYDKSLHPFGSTWNTGDCLSCDCEHYGMNCCIRYHSVGRVPGCTAVLDPETCTYLFYKEDDPTALCFYQP